jgi:hypothetical protein
MRNLFVSSLCFPLAFSVTFHPIVTWGAYVNSSLDNLTMASCATEGGVRVLRYEEGISRSPYASEFDKREFFVAESNNVDVLANRVGIRKTRHGLALRTTLLASAPEPSQIASRDALRKTTASNNWTIFAEHVQYAAQGSVMGFTIECGTAIQLHPSKGKFLAASECFSLENKKRFLATLTKIDSKASECDDGRNRMPD